MEVKPIHQSKHPNYPILEYYIENPEIFSRNIPNRWLKNKCIATSLSVFVLCGSAPYLAKSNPENIEVATTIKGSDVMTSNKKKKDYQDTVKVAPIFAHGSGSGATGCIVMSPPVFMSEDEARKIIFDALAAEKILLDTANCPVIKFKAPLISSVSSREEIDSADVEIKMDAYNEKYNLSIQFVSREDCREFRSPYGWITLENVNTKEVATLIREELNTTGKSNAVVFYDPIINVYDPTDIYDPVTDISDQGEKSWAENKYEAKEKAKKLLLAQVNDFIEWFKKENIIK